MSGMPDMISQIMVNTDTCVRDLRCITAGQSPLYRAIRCHTLQYRRFLSAGPWSRTHGHMSSTPIPPPAPPASPPPSPGPWPGAGMLLTLVNGVLAGVSGAYVSTRSVTITVIAVAMAIGLTLIVLFSRKK